MQLKKATSAAKLSPAQKKKIEKQYQNQIKEEVLGLEAKSDSAKTVEEKIQPKLSTAPASVSVSKIIIKGLPEKKLIPKQEEELSEAELAEIREAVLAEIAMPNSAKRQETGRVQDKILPLASRCEQTQNIAVIIGPKGVKHHLKRTVRIIFLAVVFFLFLSAAGIYLGGWDTLAIKKIAEFIPYPVLKVNSRLISAKTYFNDLSALRKYLDRLNITASGMEIKLQVMESLIEKEVIAQLAQEQGLSVSSKELQPQLDLIVASAASKEEIEKLVNDLYNWDLTEYGEKIIKPLLLAQKVEQRFNQSAANLAIKKQMEDYAFELAKDPAKFEEIAQTVNQDNTKYTEGDLGWFVLGEMVPEFEAALINLEPGQLSGVAESRYGYHIIKLSERLLDDKTGQNTFHAAHIFLERPSFTEYLNGQIKKAKVLTLIKI